MSANDERLRSLITQQAADWFIANRAGLTGRERQAFVEWLRESPVHIAEYLALSVIAGDLRRACEGSQDSLEEILERSRRADQPPGATAWRRLLAAARELAPPRWQAAALTTGAFVAVAVGLALLWRLSPLAHAPTAEAVTLLHFQTRHGEQQTQRLADDSVLHLNTDSAVTVRYGRNERRVTLTAGEADFEVAHESARPFRVFAGSAEIVDLGTRFDVRLEDDSTVVTVAAGRVAVALTVAAAGGGTSAVSGRTAPAVELTADQQLTVAAGDWPVTPVAVDAERSTAWLHRQISFNHERLERVAREFNRYSPKPIEISSPALRNLEISGVFSTDDIDAFIAFLRSLDGVHVEVTETRIRVSQN